MTITDEVVEKACRIFYDFDGGEPDGRRAVRAALEAVAPMLEREILADIIEELPAHVRNRFIAQGMREAAEIYGKPGEWAFYAAAFHAILARAQELDPQ
jgi:hypothetical protein